MRGRNESAGIGGVRSKVVMSMRYERVTYRCWTRLRLVHSRDCKIERDHRLCIPAITKSIGDT